LGTSATEKETQMTFEERIVALEKMTTPFYDRLATQCVGALYESVRPDIYNAAIRNAIKLHFTEIQLSLTNKLSATGYALRFVKSVLPDWRWRMYCDAYIDGVYQGDGLYRSDVLSPWSSGSVTQYSIACTPAMSLTLASLKAIANGHKAF